jgi:hypothetical protein
MSSPPSSAMSALVRFTFDIVAMEDSPRPHADALRPTRYAITAPASTSSSRSSER